MRIGVLIIWLSSCFVSFADEELKEAKWLSDFFNSGLTKAEAVWKHEEPAYYNKDEKKTVVFDFKKQVYSIKYTLTYTENWEVLTKEGTQNPPLMEKTYPTSVVNNWTRFKETGTYEEVFYRDIPNWLVFKNLDTLLISIASLEVKPAINALLWSDEQKYIRKLFRRNKMMSANVWKQFIYDKRRRVIGIDTPYLSANCQIKKQDSHSAYHVVFQNENGDELIVYPCLNTIHPMLMDGVLFRLNDKERIVFNFAVNEMMHRFAPDIFRDPDVVIQQFLLAVEEYVGKSLERLENSKVDNE
ncbi:MAG: hypothetical protein WDZ35_04430 [Crocinitomicaceae bacterium]